MNVEMDKGATEQHLFNVFYGDAANGDCGNWRERAIFVSFVLKPLEWSGLVFAQDAERGDKKDGHYFKTPLWRSSLVLETDEHLGALTVQ